MSVAYQSPPTTPTVASPNQSSGGKTCTLAAALPGATEDVRWGADLVCSFGDEMFRVVLFARLTKKLHRELYP